LTPATHQPIDKPSPSINQVRGPSVEHSPSPALLTMSTSASTSRSHVGFHWTADGHW